MSRYYAWRKRDNSKRTKQDEVLGKKIVELFTASGDSYGSVRLHQALKQSGEDIGRNRVIKLMKHHNLQAKAKRKYKV